MSASGKKAAGPAAVNPKYLQPGTVLGSNTIVDHLGSGGLATVYKVSNGRAQYALKIATYDSDDDRTNFDERAKREACALLKLRHPNIVNVHEFARWPDIVDGYPYLVMDLVDGVPLYKWQAGANPRLQRIIRVFVKVADALAYMHKSEVVHRDLKSDNILVRQPDDEPIIIDFNIARPASSYTLTHVGGFIGTPSHLTPEACAHFKLQGEKPKFEFGVPQELHSIGFILYEMCLGRPPFPQGEDPIQTMIRIEKTRPAPLHEVAPAVPEALSDIVMKCLAHDPAARYQDAAVLAQDLKAALPLIPDEPFPCPLPARRARSSGSGSASLSELSSGDIEPLSDEGKPQTVPDRLRARQAEGRPSRSTRRLAMGAAGPVSLALAAFGYWAWHPAQPAVPTSNPPVAAHEGPLAQALVPAPTKAAEGEGTKTTEPSPKVDPTTNPATEPAPAPIVPAPGAPVPTPIPVLRAAKDTRKKPSASETAAPRQPAEPTNGVLVRAQRTVAASAPSLGVPAGTRLRARLGSDLAAAGQKAEGVLTRPFLFNSQTVFPSRTKVLGTVESIAGQRLTLRFSKAVLPDGTEIPLSALAYSTEDARPGLEGPSASGQPQVAAGTMFDLVLQDPL